MTSNSVLVEMFPGLGAEVIRDVVQSANGNVELAIGMLLQLTDTKQPQCNTQSETTTSFGQNSNSDSVGLDSKNSSSDSTGFTSSTNSNSEYENPFIGKYNRNSTYSSFNTNTNKYSSPLANLQHSSPSNSSSGYTSSSSTTDNIGASTFSNPSTVNDIPQKRSALSRLVLSVDKNEKQPEHQSQLGLNKPQTKSALDSLVLSIDKNKTSDKPPSSPLFTTSASTQTSVPSVQRPTSQESRDYIFSLNLETERIKRETEELKKRIKEQEEQDRKTGQIPIYFGWSSSDSTQQAPLPNPPLIPRVVNTLPKDCTVDQKAEVDRVLNCQDYYEILRVDRNATNEELTKNYRKLALVLHPDKNKIPGAEDAFKQIAEAFTVLNDPETRIKYNLFGRNATVNEDVLRRAQAFSEETKILIILHLYQALNEMIKNAL